LAAVTVRTFENDVKIYHGIVNIITITMGIGKRWRIIGNILLFAAVCLKDPPLMPSNAVVPFLR
jgi:hypothetical protein